jgi:hypothetical protein
MRVRDLERLLLANDLGEVEARIALEENARKTHPYVADLIRILAPHRFGLRRRLVMNQMRHLRGPAALNQPKKFEEAVQSAFQRHSKQSKTFQLGPEDDLFYWPRGKGGAGVVWAVHNERASAWLKARSLPDI